ncbi:hypothetical protein F511_23761 [Dorcoceras hygrometricum]|uniref:Uncharacterized protein n=1 Tax=Dorcoceras hygrometricum TaxID=472368 RepID=A0A2Z7DF41_9LAMI|nr:hypothetical protein F511_23761 [Dorcoceras hygrometricum]
MVLTKDVFTEAFGLPIEGLTIFLDIPKETLVEMRRRFSGSDEPFKAPKTRSEQSQAVQGKICSELSGMLVKDKPAKVIQSSWLRSNQLRILRCDG